MNIAAAPIASSSKADAVSGAALKIAFVAAETEAARSAKSEACRDLWRYSRRGRRCLIVALGGDGLMLQTLERFRGTAKPVYGMHRGLVGFLMNEYREAHAHRAARGGATQHRPSLADDGGDGRRDAEGACDQRGVRDARDLSGGAPSHQRRWHGAPRRAHRRRRAGRDAGGLTACNLSCNGPIIPLAAPLLALTPISPFRPRRWRGALLPDRAKFVIEVLEAEKRPVAAVADHIEIRDAKSVAIGDGSNHRSRDAARSRSQPRRAHHPRAVRAVKVHAFRWKRRNARPRIIFRRPISSKHRRCFCGSCRAAQAARATATASSSRSVEAC